MRGRSPNRNASPKSPHRPSRKPGGAEYYLKRFQELGLKDASIDSEGNVTALRKGSGGGRPKLVVSAHLDTVFPEGTDVSVKKKDGAIFAPGIGDDWRGLAASLSSLKSHQCERDRDGGRPDVRRHGRRGRTRQPPRRQGAVPRSHRH